MAFFPYTAVTSTVNVTVSLCSLVSEISSLTLPPQLLKKQLPNQVFKIAALPII